MSKIKTPKLKVDLMDGMGWLYIYADVHHRNASYSYIYCTLYQGAITRSHAPTSWQGATELMRSARPSDSPKVDAVGVRTN